MSEHFTGNLKIDGRCRIIECNYLLQTLKEECQKHKVSYIYLNSV